LRIIQRGECLSHVCRGGAKMLLLLLILLFIFVAGQNV
jgi:hypothetical protein